MPKLAARYRPKRPDAPANARARKVGIVHGAGSRAVWGRLDARFAFAKAVTTYERAYRAHLGGELSTPQADLCDSAARHKALRNVAFTRLMERGVFDEAGNLTPAFDAFRKADAELRAVLDKLGIERRSRELSLGQVLSEEQRDGSS